MSKTKLVSAKWLFSETLSKMLEEHGITYDTSTREEIESYVNACVDKGYMQVWNEFMAWVEYGDDQKAKTLAAIKSSRGAWRGFR